MQVSVWCPVIQSRTMICKMSEPGGDYVKTHRWILGVAALFAAVLAGCGGGGTVATQSGAAKAVFPANAVNASTTVTITASSQAPTSARLIDGTAYEFSPSGPLAQPVQVTLRYNPAKLPSGALQSNLVLYKADNGAWVAVPNSTASTRWPTR
jgi:hypothetical protein